MVTGHTRFAVLRAVIGGNPIIDLKPFNTLGDNRLVTDGLTPVPRIQNRQITFIHFFMYGFSAILEDYV